MKRLLFLFFLVILFGCQEEATIDWDVQGNEVSGVLSCECKEAVVEILVTDGNGIDTIGEFVVYPSKKFSKFVQHDWEGIHLEIKKTR